MPVLFQLCEEIQPGDWKPPVEKEEHLLPSWLKASLPYIQEAGAAFSQRSIVWISAASGSQTSTIDPCKLHQLFLLRRLPKKPRNEELTLKEFLLSAGSVRFFGCRDKIGNPELSVGEGLMLGAGQGLDVEPTPEGNTAACTGRKAKDELLLYLKTGIRDSLEQKAGSLRRNVSKPGEQLLSGRSRQPLC
uniref:Uncharacterized protein n=1 Tax=Sphaerodactylus townsendi TaxID=933632 RepID=A0ACB8G781_9SAUR